MNGTEVVLAVLYAVFVLTIVIIMGMLFYAMEGGDKVKRKDDEPELVYFLRHIPIFIYYFFRGMMIGALLIPWTIYQNIRYLVTGEQSRRFKDE